MAYTEQVLQRLRVSSYLIPEKVSFIFLYNRLEHLFATFKAEASKRYMSSSFSILPLLAVRHPYGVEIILPCKERNSNLDLSAQISRETNSGGLPRSF